MNADQLLAVLQTRSDRSLGERSHHGVALCVGMKSVVTQLVFQEAFVVSHGGEVVEIAVTMHRGVIFYPLIEREDLVDAGGVLRLSSL